MFSIIVPTFNNLKYLQITLKSIVQNSKFNHDIIVHVNEGTDGTLNYLKTNNINHTYSDKNLGLCSAVNIAAKKLLLNIFYILMMTCISVQIGIFFFTKRLRN